LTARAKRMKKSHDIEILFIDYLTLIKSDSRHATKHMQVDEVSKGLQSLAKALKIPVVCLAQLNRASTGKDGDVPTLTSFRESGSIEEDADGCLLIHRPDYYNPTAKPGYVELIIAKNRIMGTLKKIDYSCNFSVSDRYFECLPLEEDVKRMVEENNPFIFKKKG
jgi:replicative DNA helicase